MNAKDKERQEAIETLRKHINPGDTLHTVLRHVSKSGMYRVIDVFVIKDNVPIRLSYSAAKAIGVKYDSRHEGAGMGGCGMDMGFSLIYDIGSVLFRDGYECTGEGCPSNDHHNAYYLTSKGVCPVCGNNLPEGVNLKRRGHAVCSEACATGPWHHKDGGYALNHHWL